MIPDSLIESLKDCPVMDRNGYQYFIHPLADGVPSIDPKLLDDVASAIIEITDLDCDYIITSEALGLPISTAVSLKCGRPMLIVRKRPYGLPGEVVIDQSTGYSKNELYINCVKKGDRVVILDDVISTGGTMRALISSLKKIGCTIVDACVIFGKSEVSEDIEKEFGVKVKSVAQIRIADGKVTLRD